MTCPLCGTEHNSTACPPRQEVWHTYPSDQTIAEAIASAVAHRACTNSEQDPRNGKLAGYCVVCGVPWPCETAKTFLREAK